MEYVALLSSPLWNHEELARSVMDCRPGGLIRVNRPDDVVWLPRPTKTKDCAGCGAPLKAYIHHCEYCRRAA